MVRKPPNQRYECAWQHARVACCMISRISRIFEFRTPKFLFKVCLNFLEKELIMPTFIRVLREIRDSDTHAKNFTHSKVKFYLTFPL